MIEGVKILSTCYMCLVMTGFTMLRTTREKQRKNKTSVTQKLIFSTICEYLFY